MSRHRVHLEADEHGHYAAVCPLEFGIDRDNVLFGRGPSPSDAIADALHIGSATFDSQDSELDALRTGVIRGRDLLISVRGRVIATLAV